MKRVAFAVRATAIAISLVYMLFLLPHLGGVGADHFKSPWLLGALIIAVAWLPLLLFRRHFDRQKGALQLVTSSLPFMLFAAYFGALFSAA